MKRNTTFVAILTIGAVLYSGCTTTTSLQKVQEEVSDQSDLQQFYTQTIQRLNSQYYVPELQGNILASRTPSQLVVSDNTVYLGNLLAWQSYHFMMTKDPAYISKMSSIVSFILNTLSIPTTVPGIPGTNRGYFQRDNVTQTSITLNGTTYPISSDANSSKPSDNDMSQDQLIHVMFGYYAAMQAIASSPDMSSQTADLKSMIMSHTDQIGVRLKAYNYMLETPAGQPVARGADVRAFSWPLAKTFSAITTQPLEKYLDGITAIDIDQKQLRLSNTDLKNLMIAGLKGLTIGVCDIKIGKDKQEICNRFTLRMINILYGTAELYQDVPLYVDRIDKDGDYLGGLWVRRKKNMRIPNSYYENLENAVNVTFSCNVEPMLWCADNRWIRMPTSCPEDGCNSSNLSSHNAIDFLGLFALLSTKNI